MRDVASIEMLPVAFNTRLPSVALLAALLSNAVTSITALLVSVMLPYVCVPARLQPRPPLIAVPPAPTQSLVVLLPSITRSAASTLPAPNATPSPIRHDKPKRTKGEVMVNLRQ